MRQIVTTTAKTPRLAALTLLLCFLVAGCSPPVPRITLAPTLTPSPSSGQPVHETQSPTNTSTPTPTVTQQPSPSPSPTPRTYVVQKGDVLGGIARDWGITLESIIEANGIEDPSRLSIGQVLIIPPPTAIPESGNPANATPRPTFTPRPTASPIPSDRVVYITATGTEYHLEGCSRLDGRGIPITCQEATALGYRRCKLCKPGCW